MNKISTLTAAVMCSVAAPTPLAALAVPAADMDNTRPGLSQSDVLLSSIQELQLLHDDTPLCVHIHVIAMAILACGRVIAVSIAFRLDHLVARHSLQRDRSHEILAKRRVIRGKQASTAQQGD
jgi:hypothetical protein